MPACRAWGAPLRQRIVLDKGEIVYYAFFGTSGVLASSDCRDARNEVGSRAL
jgi:hypothetical protein